MEQTASPISTALFTLLAPMTIVQTCELDDGPAVEVAIECVTHEDCGLVPAFVSCCQECEPAPPFEAVPRSKLDAIWLDLEPYCAETASRCEQIPCPTIPPGCVAFAACIHGQCRVIEEGCESQIADLDRELP
jgi:hypothetical protein